MNKALAAIFCVATAAPVWAQVTPVGTWRSIDDKTGEAKAQIRIGEAAGALTGRIEKSLKKDTAPDATCVECTDDRKGQPIAGLEIIRGGRKADAKDVWEGGKILDPENGKEYRASFTPIEGGAKLEVRGYLGPFWRTQVWQRVQ
ncbi:DUF2147 domain-containing protein [Paracidovorax wautersii]|uniref:Uncharacterized conserved protein, DUF2147 family n=1 Tax=Paracidovorax wautersii TaxID=1177982 RepID=A0A1I2C415_9BURK|nr:DUF2147 domain-containing protein [Paracidovorax wautersii]SFE63111.1 Uncharacterized conserved protein, DUF2147 family [Paracidovorax wautersii]